MSDLKIGQKVLFRLPNKNGALRMRPALVTALEEGVHLIVFLGAYDTDVATWPWRQYAPWDHQGAGTDVMQFMPAG